MKYKYLAMCIMLAVTVLPTASYACNDKSCGNNPTAVASAKTDNENTNFNNNMNKNTSTSNSYSNSFSAANSNSKSNSNSNVSNRTNNMVYNEGSKASANGEVNISETTKIDPPAYAPDVATGNTTTISCNTGVGGSLGAAGVVSLGIAGTEEDEDCTLRENIKIVSTLDHALAVEMMKDLKGVQAALDRIADRKAGKTVKRTAKAEEVNALPSGKVAGFNVYNEYPGQPKIHTWDK